MQDSLSTYKNTKYCEIPLDHYKAVSLNSMICNDLIYNESEYEIYFIKICFLSIICIQTKLLVIWGHPMVVDVMNTYLNVPHYFHML